MAGQEAWFEAGAVATVRTSRVARAGLDSTAKSGLLKPGLDWQFYVNQLRTSRAV